MRREAKWRSSRASKYVACVAVAFAAAPSFGQSAPRAYTLVGAGDIANCRSNVDEATARLVGSTAGLVFTLGDNVQGRGTASEFANCYNPSWGRFKFRTRPAVGNHEYHTPGARPYYNYFGEKAGVAGRGYYAYKRGGWLVVVLNSNCGIVRCGPNSPQVAWLKKVLAENQARCTAAMFHHPLFSTNAPTPGARPLWNVLYQNRADIILNGHAHSYERFAPQRPNGVIDTNRGIRQIAVGTGGAGADQAVRPQAQKQRRPKRSNPRSTQTQPGFQLL